MTAKTFSSSQVVPFRRYDYNKHVQQRLAALRDFRKEYLNSILIAGVNDQSDPVPTLMHSWMLWPQKLKILKGCHALGRTLKALRGEVICQAIFYLILKDAGTDPDRWNVRLVVQESTDPDKLIWCTSVLKHASVRLTITKTIITGYVIWKICVHLAFFQSEETARQCFDEHLPEQLRVFPAVTLKYLESLYGVRDHHYCLHDTFWIKN